MAQHLSFFVYGTLRRGQRRQAMWPCEPLDVELATTQGQLFDLGPYPGLATGTDVVLGELWHVRAEDFAQTVQRLDQIEGFHQGGPDYYQRRVVPCHTLDGRNVQAYTYFFLQLDHFPAAVRIEPLANGCCQWPA